MPHQVLLAGLAPSKHSPNSGLCGAQNIASQLVRIGHRVPFEQPQRIGCHDGGVTDIPQEIYVAPDEPDRICGSEASDLRRIGPLAHVVKTTGIFHHSPFADEPEGIRDGGGMMDRRAERRVGVNVLNGAVRPGQLAGATDGVEGIVGSRSRLGDSGQKPIAVLVAGEHGPHRVVLANDVAETDGIDDVSRYSVVFLDGKAIAQGVVGVLPCVVAAGDGNQAVFVVVGVRRGAVEAGLLDQVAVGVEEVGPFADLDVLVHVVRGVFGRLAMADRADPVAHGVVHVGQVFVGDVRVG